MYLDNLTWKGKKLRIRPKAQPPHHQLLLYQHLRAIIWNVTSETSYEGHARCSHKHCYFPQSLQHCNQAKSCHKPLILARLQRFWPDHWFRRLAPPAAAGGTQTGKALTSVSSNLAKKKAGREWFKKRLVLITKNSSCKVHLNSWLECSSMYILHHSWKKTWPLKLSQGFLSFVICFRWGDPVAGSTGRPRSKANCAEVSSMNASSLTNRMTQLLKPLNSAGTLKINALKGESYV